MDDLLALRDLSVAFDTDTGRIGVVDDVSFAVPAGRTVSLVGESGCGKSVTAASIMRLLPQPYGHVTSGEIRFDGRDLLQLPAEEMYRIRGGEIAMIFQEPMTALNPVHKAGKQIKETFRLHRPDLSKTTWQREAVRLLEQVEMPSAVERVDNYPFQMSGGMRQRMMIAMALAGRPKLLIADEPTTALDVTVQAQILALIKELQDQTGMGVLYITHDMGVVAEVSDTVVVMYAGQVVERAPVRTIFAAPRHPYTQGLIASMPSLNSQPKSLLPAIAGSVPAPVDYPTVCRFSERCPLVADVCRSVEPHLEAIGDDHDVRCFRTDMTASGSVFARASATKRPEGTRR